MRRLFLMTAVLLFGCNAGLAQVSTMGTTAMGLPTTPATIVISPLYGPSPFSATTQPGTPDTTLAPVPLASDPTIPGTVVTCATPIAQITPGTQAVTVTAPLPSPSIAAPPVPTSSVATTSPTAMTPAAPLVTIPSQIVVTTTGNVSPTSPLGSPSTTVCSSMPGGPPTNGAALPLSTPEIPASPPPGTFQQDITQPAGTSIDPTTAVMPTPNTSACAESTTINLATPSTMAPANATGTAATPGISPPGC
jgi:hypothetical protein